ncbi:MAG: hypothetical protein V1875_01890 [Candidatus Altiarchaeota archaeon]
MKKAVFAMAAVIFLAIILALAYSAGVRYEPQPIELPGIPPELIFNEEITVMEPPPGSFQVLPCVLEYGDNMTTYSGGTINVSLNAGKAESVKDAVYKVKENLGRLKTLYSEETGGECFGIWGCDWVGWSSRIFVKHRTTKEKYGRDGWYITALDKDGAIMGEFFLSDEGILMPAQQTCTRVGCCV